MSLIIEWIRNMMFSIDKIIYAMISKVYDLLITIARTSPLSQADILAIADRIYKLLAIFMVFKVTFSLIMYVVNPDDFTDKSKGLGKLSLNIVLVFALLILTPHIFNMAYDLQRIVLEDNAIAGLIFGEKNDKDNDFFTSAGDDMAYIAISPFFVPDVSIQKGTLYNCTTLLKDNKMNESCSGISNDSLTEVSSSSTTLYDLTKKEGSTFTDTMLKNYVTGINNKSLGMVFRKELVEAQVDGEFIMDYSYIVSTAVGVIILILLVNFCLDVSIRSIKFAFLQLIAPIPIISYIDPKSGKDGLFKKWTQLCVKTYLSLFIRLLALYFAVYIISMVGDLGLVDVVDSSYVTSRLILVIIIIGALMFAKQLPNILKDLGIKLDSDGFKLNPLKRMEEGMIGGKKIMGTARGLAAGAAIGTAGVLTGAGIGRGISGMFGGMKAGFQGKKFGEIKKDQATKNAEMRRAIASGSTWFGRRGAQFSSIFGTPGRLGRIEHDKIEAQNEIDNLKSQKKSVQDRIAPKKAVIAKQQAVNKSIGGMESFATSLIEGGKAGNYSKTYKQLDTDHNYLTNNIGQRAAYDIKDANGNIVVNRGNTITNEAAMKLNGEKEKYSKKIGREAVINELLQRKNGTMTGGEIGDGDLEHFKAQYYSYEKDVDDYNATVKEYEDNVSEDDKNELRNQGVDVEAITIQDDFKSLHDQSTNLDTISTYVQASIKDQESEMEKIDRDVQSYEVTLEELNAQEKTAKANAEVVHATQGGPANPGSIRPAQSTVGRRTGGPGSGMGGGPGGPGPGTP